MLVDDGGRTPLDAVVAEYRDRLEIRLLRQANGGCAAARQRGVESARGAWLAFTDDDCRPARNWLSRFYDVLTSNRGCAVGGATINALGGDPYAETTQLVVNYLSTQNDADGGSVRYCPTSNLAFPAAEFRAMGGLDPGWRIPGGEDRDLCARWRQAGYRILMDPAARVYHLHGLTASQFLRQHFCYGRGAALFHRPEGQFAGRRDYGYEPWWFYARLLAEPFRLHRGWRAARLSVLVTAAQAATAAGAAAQFVGRRIGPPFGSGAHARNGR